MKKNKKAISLFLCLMMLLPYFSTASVFSLKSKAATEGIFTYNITDGAATITSIDENATGHITIPSEIGSYPVKTIARNTLASNSGITEITISEGIEIIDYDSLSGSSALKAIHIPSTVTRLGGAQSHIKTFYGSSVEILTVAENNAVYMSADNIIYSKDMKTLHYYAPCKTDESFSVPLGITHIDNAAFSRAKNLKEIYLPESLISTGERAFANCTALKTLELPKNFASLGNASFSACTALESVTVHPENTVYSSENGILYSENGTKLLFFPAGYKGTEFTIPSRVTSIEEEVFGSDTKLEKLVFPASLQSVKVSSFLYLRNCKIYFMNPDIEITPSVMANFIGITIHSFEGSTAEEFAAAEQVVYYIIDKETGAETLGTFTSTEGIYTYRVSNAEAQLISVDTSAEGDITVPATLGGYPLTSTKLHSFLRNDKVTSITFSEGLISIPGGSVASCASLKSVYIPASVSYIEEDALCTNVPMFEKFEVSSENEHYCAVDGILYTKDMKTLMQYPPAKADEIFAIPEETTIINYNAFNYCSNLKEIIFHDKTEEINIGAFMHCDGLTSVDIPASVTHIGEDAFLYCDNLVSINVAPDNTKYKSVDGILYETDRNVLIFYPNANPIKDFVIPEGVTLQGDRVFNGDGILNSLTFPENINMVYVSTFERLKNTDIYFLNPNIIINGQYVTPTGITIYGYDNSTAEDFATAQNIPFAAIVSEEETTESEETTTEPEEEFTFPTYNTDFENEDVIEFGSFPQTLVTDEELIEELGWYIDDDMWQSLGWFKGDNSYGSMEKCEDGKYCDIDYYGEKYRAVTFSEYRKATSITTGNAYQSTWGYKKDNIYFFKFEPLKWRIIDAEKGYVLADSIIDVQPYQALAYRTSDLLDIGNAFNFWADSEHTIMATEWEHSTMREYLNSDFYNTAFTDAQKSVINTVKLENPVVPAGNPICNGKDTFDKIFLFSYEDASGNNLISPDRTRAGTDYAKCQGLFNTAAHDMAASVNGFYWLRTPYNTSYISYVQENGRTAYSNLNFNSQDTGVVPAMYINLEAFTQKNLYENIKIDFNNGVLTVSGNGILPDPTKSITTPLKEFSEITTAVIIKDGITEISENAFMGFFETKTLIFEGNTVLCDKAFPDSFQLSTVVFKENTTINGNPFANDIYYVNIFVSHGKSCAYEYLPEGVSAFTYLFNDTNIEINGNVTMSTYEFFDFIAVMCDDYENVETVSFNTFTSTDLRFYTYDSKTGQKKIIPDSTISDAVFSVEVSQNSSPEKVSFNTLCEMAANGTLEEFWLITKSTTISDIQDTGMEINSLEDLITYALKWIVSLLNFFFSLFSRL